MLSESRTEGSRTRSSESLSTTIVEAVAEASGTDPIELPPLYDYVDPDALDAVFAPTSTGMSRTGTIEFGYDGYVVTIDCDDEPTTTLDEQAAD